MKFNEKLQALRRDKGLTQEELAEKLYVSRTAVSKWESDRGFPSIESLKAISKYFSISLDNLLSSEEILAISEEEHRKKETNLRDLCFGLLDFGMLLLLFLPLFGQTSGANIESVSLFRLIGISSYLKITYFILVFLNSIFGVITLALQNCHLGFWIKYKGLFSLFLSIVAVVVFIISRQSYAAIFIFSFLIIKALMMIKQR